MSPNLEADVAVDNEEELNESKIFQEEIKALLTEVSNIFKYVQFSFLSFEYFFQSLCRYRFTTSLMSQLQEAQNP